MTIGRAMMLLVGVPVIVLLALSRWLAPKRRDPRLDVDDDGPQF